MLKQYKLRNYNFRLVFYVVALTILGILVIGSAKESVQNKQTLGLFLGIIAMLCVSMMDYSFLLRFSWLYYIMNIGLLVLVKVIGDDSNGATRWVEIAGLRFQPSELAKIIIILFFAYFFMKHQEQLNTVKILGLSFILAGIPLVLIKEQPDLSTTIVTAVIFVSLLFIAGLSYKIVISVLAVSIPSFIIFISLILQPDQKILDGYQYKRIMAWLQPEKYADTAYQQLNSKMAIGSGQLWGKGLNNSQITSVKNGNFISEPQTDFIFAIVGEELGFVGSVIVIIFNYIRMYINGKKSKGYFWKINLLRNGFLNRFPGICQYMRCYGPYAQYRTAASICQLRSDIFSYFISGNRIRFECRITA